MIRLSMLFALLASSLSGWTLIPHEEIASFEAEGNTMMGLATRNLGAQDFEVWQRNLTPGSTSPHVIHDSEGIFVFLKGKGKMTIGEEEFLIEAPCTVICPPLIEHLIENTGDDPLEHLLVLGIDAKIASAKDFKEIEIPWRE